MLKHFNTHNGSSLTGMLAVIALVSVMSAKLVSQFQTQAADVTHGAYDTKIAALHKAVLRYYNASCANPSMPSTVTIPQLIASGNIRADAQSAIIDDGRITIRIMSPRTPGVWFRYTLHTEDDDVRDRIFRESGTAFSAGEGHVRWHLQSDGYSNDNQVQNSAYLESFEQDACV